MLSPMAYGILFRDSIQVYGRIIGSKIKNRVMQEQLCNLEHITEYENHIFLMYITMTVKMQASRFYKLLLVHIPGFSNGKQNTVEFLRHESFTLQSWTLSDEQDRDLAATAPSSCSPPLPSGSLNIPSTPVQSTTKKKKSTNKVKTEKLEHIFFQKNDDQLQKVKPMLARHS